MIKLTKKEAFKKKVTTYEIFIDDQSQGEMRGNITQEFPVQNGKHCVYAKLNWCSSNKFYVDVDDSPKHLIVRPRMNNKMLTIIFIFSILAVAVFSYFSFMNNPPPSAVQLAVPSAVPSENEGYVPRELQMIRSWLETLGIRTEAESSPYSLAFTEFISLVIGLAGVGFVGVIIAGLLSMTVFRSRYLHIYEKETEVE